MKMEIGVQGKGGQGSEQSDLAVGNAARSRGSELDDLWGVLQHKAS